MVPYLYVIIVSTNNSDSLVEHHSANVFEIRINYNGSDSQISYVMFTNDVDKLV